MSIYSGKYEVTEDGKTLKVVKAEGPHAIYMPYTSNEFYIRSNIPKLGTADIEATFYLMKTVQNPVSGGMIDYDRLGEDDIDFDNENLCGIVNVTYSPSSKTTSIGYLLAFDDWEVVKENGNVVDNGYNGTVDHDKFMTDLRTIGVGIYYSSRRKRVYMSFNGLQLSCEVDPDVYKGVIAKISTRGDIPVGTLFAFNKLEKFEIPKEPEKEPESVLNATNYEVDKFKTIETSDLADYSGHIQWLKPDPDSNDAGKKDYTLVSNDACAIIPIDHRFNNYSRNSTNEVFVRAQPTMAGHIDIVAHITDKGIDYNTTSTDTPPSQYAAVMDKINSSKTNKAYKYVKVHVKYNTANSNYDVTISTAGIVTYRYENKGPTLDASTLSGNSILKTTYDSDKIEELASRGIGFLISRVEARVYIDILGSVYSIPTGLKHEKLLYHVIRKDTPPTDSSNLPPSELLPIDAVMTSGKDASYIFIGPDGISDSKIILKIANKTKATTFSFNGVHEANMSDELLFFNGNGLMFAMNKMGKAGYNLARFEIEIRPFTPEEVTQYNPNSADVKDIRAFDGSNGDISVDSNSLQGNTLTLYFKGNQNLIEIGDDTVIRTHKRAVLAMTPKDYSNVLIYIMKLDENITVQLKDWSIYGGPVVKPEPSADAEMTTYGSVEKITSKKNYIAKSTIGSRSISVRGATSGNANTITYGPPPHRGWFNIFEDKHMYGFTVGVGTYKLLINHKQKYIGPGKKYSMRIEFDLYMDAYGGNTYPLYYIGNIVVTPDDNTSTKVILHSYTKNASYLNGFIMPLYNTNNGGDYTTLYITVTESYGLYFNGIEDKGLGSSATLVYLNNYNILGSMIGVQVMTPSNEYLNYISREDTPYLAPNHTFSKGKNGTYIVLKDGLEWMNNPLTNVDDETYNNFNLIGDTTKAEGLVSYLNSTSVYGYDDWTLPTSEQLEKYLASVHGSPYKLSDYVNDYIIKDVVSTTNKHIVAVRTIYDDFATSASKPKTVFNDGKPKPFKYSNSAGNIFIETNDNYTTETRSNSFKYIPQVGHNAPPIDIERSLPNLGYNSSTLYKGQSVEYIKQFLYLNTHTPIMSSSKYLVSGIGMSTVDPYKQDNNNTYENDINSMLDTHVPICFLTQFLEDYAFYLPIYEYGDFACHFNIVGLDDKNKYPDNLVSNIKPELPSDQDKYNIHVSFYQGKLTVLSTGGLNYISEYASADNFLAAPSGKHMSSLRMYQKQITKEEIQEIAIAGIRISFKDGIVILKIKDILLAAKLPKGSNYMLLGAGCSGNINDHIAYMTTIPTAEYNVLPVNTSVPFKDTKWVTYKDEVAVKEDVLDISTISTGTIDNGRFYHPNGSSLSTTIYTADIEEFVINILPLPGVLPPDTDFKSNSMKLSQSNKEEDDNKYYNKSITRYRVTFKLVNGRMDISVKDTSNQLPIYEDNSKDVDFLTIYESMAVTGIHVTYDAGTIKIKCGTYNLSIPRQDTLPRVESLFVCLYIDTNKGKISSKPLTYVVPAIPYDANTDKVKDYEGYRVSTHKRNEWLTPKTKDTSIVDQLTNNNLTAELSKGSIAVSKFTTRYERITSDFYSLNDRANNTTFTIVLRPRPAEILTNTNLTDYTAVLGYDPTNSAYYKQDEDIKLVFSIKQNKNWRGEYQSTNYYLKVEGTIGGNKLVDLGGTYTNITNSYSIDLNEQESKRLSKAGIGILYDTTNHKLYIDALKTAIAIDLPATYHNGGIAIIAHKENSGGNAKQKVSFLPVYAPPPITTVGDDSSYILVLPGKYYTPPAAEARILFIDQPAVNSMSLPNFYTDHSIKIERIGEEYIGQTYTKIPGYYVNFTKHNFKKEGANCVSAMLNKSVKNFRLYQDGDALFTGGLSDNYSQNYVNINVVIVEGDIGVTVTENEIRFDDPEVIDMNKIMNSNYIKMFFQYSDGANKYGSIYGNIIGTYYGNEIINDRYDRYKIETKPGKRADNEIDFTLSLDKRSRLYLGRGGNFDTGIGSGIGADDPSLIPRSRADGGIGMSIDDDKNVYFHHSGTKVKIPINPAIGKAFKNPKFLVQFDLITTDYFDDYSIAERKLLIDMYPDKRRNNEFHIVGHNTPTVFTIRSDLKNY